ncbi:MAG: hypothetical protein ACRDS9_25785 [Pseudonocardiaceae bacterium]
MLPTLIHENPGSLDQRVHNHREPLITLMAAAGRCDDISSGFVVDFDDIVTDPNSTTSDRRLKCDIVAVDWSR